MATETHVDGTRVRSHRSGGDSERHARRVLRGFGLRSTPQRLAVLDLLGRAARSDDPASAAHLTVADMHDQLSAAGQHMERSTIYRTVSTLADHGVLHAIAYLDRPAAYGLAGVAHHHAVCNECGSVLEIDTAQLAAAMDVIERITGFRVVDTRLTAHGICRSCRGEASSSGS